MGSHADHNPPLGNHWDADPPPPGTESFTPVPRTAPPHHYPQHSRQTDYHPNSHCDHQHANGHNFSSGPNAGFNGGYWPDKSMRYSGRKRTYYHSTRGPTAAAAATSDNFVKLYVTCLPKTATEEDIHSVFGKYGKIREVVILKDKKTGWQQGTCFVKFETVDEAEKAIRALHNQYTYSGASEPVKVKFALGEQERLGIQDVKVYVNNLSKQGTKKEIEEIFSKYGNVEDVQVLYDEMKHSRGSGFITFSNKEMALAAICALSGKYSMKDCEQPLVVRFADPRKPQTGNGDLRTNSTFRGPSFPPLTQGPVRRYRPPMIHDLSCGGQFLPNILNETPMIDSSAPMHTVPTNALPQAIPLVSCKLPTALAAMQHGAHPQQCSSPQALLTSCYPVNSLGEPSPASTETVALTINPVGNPEKQVLAQHNDNRVIKDKVLSKDENVDPAFEEQPLCSMDRSGTRSQTVATSADTKSVTPSTSSACPVMSANLEKISSLDCDWSEHFCPDGLKYYYNSETCESRWEKPAEYASFERHVLKLIQLETSLPQSAPSHQTLPSH